MLSKLAILDEIRRTAHANGGKALGTARFEQETGIRVLEWGKYWARFSDLLREAGLEANEFQQAHPENFVATKIASLCRALGHFPTFREIEVARQTDRELPSQRVYRRLGGKEGLARAILRYCANQQGMEDVAALCRMVIAPGDETIVSSELPIEIGEVYLFKSGKYFKIGKTSDTVRRGAEIRIQLPERVTLIHSIKTDDPSGVEAYWHRRFGDKRMNGEWFDLSAPDVRAFKRWRKIA